MNLPQKERLNSQAKDQRTYPRKRDFRKRLKMVDREMEEMKMVEDNNEKYRLIKKNLNELSEVEKELMVLQRTTNNFG